MVGLDASGIHTMVCVQHFPIPSTCTYASSSYLSIMKCDIGLRRDLYRNIILSGGTTMLPGIADRMTKELTSFAPGSMDVMFNSVVPFPLALKKSARSRSLLRRRGSIVSGLVGPYLHHSVPSRISGARRRSTMSSVQPSSTAVSPRFRVFLISGVSEVPSVECF